MSPWFRLPLLLTLGLGGAALAAYFFATPASLYWHEDMSAQHWRGLSAHFAHLNALHLTANLLALTGLCVVAGQRRAGGLFGGAMLMSLLAIDLVLMAGVFPIQWYAGMSGLLHGGFAALAVHMAGDREPRLAWVGRLVVLGGLLKVAWEWTLPVGATGALGIPLATPVHALAYVVGVVVALAWPRRLVR